MDHPGTHLTFVGLFYFCLCIQDPQNLTYGSICTKTVTGQKKILFCCPFAIPRGGILKKKKDNFQEIMRYGQILSLPVLSPDVEY